MTTKKNSTMSAKEYRASLQTIGASQEGFADWLPIGRRTSQGYALGEYPVPAPVARLLRLMIKYRMTIDDFP